MCSWVSHLLKPRFLRNSLEPTPVGVKGSSLLPIGLQREWKVGSKAYPPPMMSAGCCAD